MKRESLPSEKINHTQDPLVKYRTDSFCRGCLCGGQVRLGRGGLNGGSSSFHRRSANGAKMFVARQLVSALCAFLKLKSKRRITCHQLIELVLGTELNLIAQGFCNGISACNIAIHISNGQRSLDAIKGFLKGLHVGCEVIGNELFKFRAVRADHLNQCRAFFLAAAPRGQVGPLFATEAGDCSWRRRANSRSCCR